MGYLTDRQDPCFTGSSKPARPADKEIDPMDTETREALRETYLYSFDGHGAVPTDLVDAEIAHNARHGRELLAVLTNANLLCQEDVNGDGDVWVPYETRDDHTRDEAENLVDTWLDEQDPTSVLADPTPSPATSTRKKVPSKMTTTEFKKCGCGCDENVPPKSTYRPGHDARHAGQVAKAMLAKGEYDDEAVAVLPSEALRDKATAIFNKRIAKVQAKEAKAAGQAVDAKEVEAVATEAAAKVTPKPAPRKRSTRQAPAKA
jgi:hypothetical protein